MKILTLRLPDALGERLESEARRKGATKSAVARDALEAFLPHGDGSAAKSIIDRAADLLGSLEGPGDLSYNKAHLQELGR